MSHPASAIYVGNYQEYIVISGCPPVLCPLVPAVYWSVIKSWVLVHACRSQLFFSMHRMDLALVDSLGECYECWQAGGWRLACLLGVSYCVNGVQR